jgi:hypothetical protein
MSAEANQIIRGRRWKRFVFVLAVLACLYAACRYTLHRMVESKLAVVRAQGYPVTLGELDKWCPEPAPGQNAADIYLEAFEHISKPKESETNLPVVGFAKTPSREEPVSGEMRQEIAGYLSANRETLQLLHQAAAMGDCRYPMGVSPEERLTAETHLFTPIRHCARLLYLEAFLSAANGNSQQATEAVTASIRLAQSLRDRATLISYLVEKACLGLTIASLEQSLSRTAFTDQQLAALGEALSKLNPSDDFTRTLIGERAWNEAGWEELRSGKVSIADMCMWSWHETRNKTFDRAAAVIYRPTGLVDLDHLASLDLQQDFINATQIDPPKRLEQIRAIQQKAERLKGLLYTQWEASLLGNATMPDARFLAQIRAARVTLAIERYRLASGNMPVSLDLLTPKFVENIPVDPFDGQPLRYKKLAKAYVVYSVGEDKVDNGGREKYDQGHMNAPGSDVTFTVER